MEMKLFYKQTTLVPIAVLIVYFLGCDSPKNGHPPTEKNKSVSAKKGYELADIFLNKLRGENIDTIILQKRTCISCCDFYNIFWTSGGSCFLKKFHGVYDAQTVDTGVIRLTGNEIFKQLSNNYNELKNSKISRTVPNLDHYCYTEINIFTTQDDIKTGRIYDSDFDKNDGYMDAQNEKERNEKYLKNLESKWNNLLTTIEKQLANMDETKTRELNVLRIKIMAKKTVTDK